MILIMSINRSTSGIFGLLAVFFALLEPIASSMIFAIIYFGFSKSGINGDFMLLPHLIVIYEVIFNFFTF